MKTDQRVSFVSSAILRRKAIRGDTFVNIDYTAGSDLTDDVLKQWIL